MSAFFDEVRSRYKDPQRFIKQLKDRMALHGISQGALAKRSGFLPPNVSAWLSDNPKHLPGMQSMVMLDEALEKLEQGE